MSSKQFSMQMVNQFLVISYILRPRQQPSHILPPNPVKSQNHQMGCYDDGITLKLDSHLGSIAAKVPVKF